MSRVFISFLGTTDYLECTYYHGDEDPVKDVRFVQEATLKIFCRDWTAEDRVLIFTTDEAYQKNWLDNGHTDRETKEPLRRTGLKNCIERLDLPVSLDQIFVPEGKSEEEIWQIFDEIYKRLGPGDEVVFDITHAFRSIPMLGIVVLNYAKVLKKIRLVGVYYGAFEVLGSIREAMELAPEKGASPSWT